MRKSCLHSGRSSRSTGSKFAKKIVMKAALVRNARAFIERQQELARRGKSIELKPSSLSLPILQEEVTSGSSGGTKAKSKEWVESDEDGGNDSGNNDNNDEVPLAQKQAASPVEEGEGDEEMREMTPLATVAEVEQEASNMEVKGEEEFEAAPAAIEEDEEEERAEEGTWSDTPSHQVGNNKLEWLGEDLGWLMPLMSAALLVDFNERVAGVEWRFQRELEAAREELLAAQACYTVAKQTLEENNIREGDWEEAEDPVKVPDNDADLDT
ncbi:hypothetical protein E4T56_gene1466 [Termitomyces sp. T112]|nr:hypothetical protein E4T56_gene1466 [Termitomyces sp. T112]